MLAVSITCCEFLILRINVYIYIPLYVHVWHLFCYAKMSEDLTGYLSCVHSYFCQTVAFFCFSPKHWMHWGMHTGVICDLDRSQVNMVLLQWSCQSALQSVSRLQERPVRESEGAHREKEPHWTAVRQVFPPVNHSPQSCSNDAGFLQRPDGWNWVKGGPNVTLATPRVDLVNYYKSHDDLENCYWTQSSEKTTLLV